MKAVRFHSFGDPGVLTYEEVERPTPGPGEVLLEVAGAGFNPIDAWIRAGLLTEIFSVALPHTPGIDVAGTVVELGSGVESFDLHERVFGMLPIPGGGAMADLVLAPATVLTQAPTSIPLADAAAAPVAALTAWQGLFEQADVRAGDRVLINGAGGGVGGLAVQLAKRADAHVVATASPRSTEAIAGYSPDQIVDYTSTELGAAVTEQVDTVFNLVATSAPQFDDLMRVTRPGGRIVTATSPQGASAEVEVRFFQVRSDAAQLADLARLIDNGELRLNISERASLTDARAIHARAEAGDLRGRVVVRPVG